MSRFPRVRVRVLAGVGGVWVLAGVGGVWVLTEVAAPGAHRGGVSGCSLG
jgi:hypothetical protein